MSRVAILIGALTVAGVVSGGCGQGSTTSSATTTPHAGAEHSVSAPAPSTSSAAANVRTISVTVHGGQVSGDTGRVQVPLGSQVTLTVHSDVADEMHLHGYDKEAEIPAGGSASIGFTADIPGVFEVELHKSDRQLLQLQVS
ncbi:MAG TPA: hypothetical protein VGJ13_03665 [Pseudonocardiaceae bacterium]